MTRAQEPKKIGALNVREHLPAEVRRVVVLLHGFGAPGDDLAGLAEELDDGKTAFYFPEAPLDLSPRPLAYGSARAWWLIDMARLERAMATGQPRDMSDETPEGLEEAHRALASTLDAIDSRFGGVPLVLGGFSQGAMLATHATFTTTRPVAGLAILSGTMLARETWVPKMPVRAGLAVFQSHGTVDALLPITVAERLRDAMAAAGLAVTYEKFSGGHGIPPTVMSAFRSWLGRLPEAKLDV